MWSPAPTDLPNTPQAQGEDCNSQKTRELAMRLSPGSVSCPMFHHRDGVSISSTGKMTKIQRGEGSVSGAGTGTGMERDSKIAKEKRHHQAQLGQFWTELWGSAEDLKEH